ncbi:MAG TPA: DUF2911 domain-containing protein [Thermoanaerobaculia bacterium]|nr:DUF2911 domain-containing protein [Thermoanaerobaculia bacterium]
MRLSKLATLFFSLLLCAGFVAAQDKKPPSPRGTAATQVGGKWVNPTDDERRRYEGGKWIEVDYGRPILRGRQDIFGSGAGYGKAVNASAPVWRAGANQTTKLKTEVALEIGGKKIPAGEYDLFVDLKEAGWTLIVSTQPTQDKYDPNDKTKIWGSYGYDPKFDVVRAPMKMITPAVSVDQFSIGFVEMTEKGGKLAMVWEKTAAIVPFTVAE